MLSTPQKKVHEGSLELMFLQSWCGQHWWRCSLYPTEKTCPICTVYCFLSWIIMMYFARESSPSAISTKTVVLMNSYIHIYVCVSLYFHIWAFLAAETFIKLPRPLQLLQVCMAVGVGLVCFRDAVANRCKIGSLYSLLGDAVWLFVLSICFSRTVRQY